MSRCRPRCAACKDFNVGDKVWVRTKHYGVVEGVVNDNERPRTGYSVDTPATLCGVTSAHPDDLWRRGHGLQFCCNGNARTS